MRKFTLFRNGNRFVELLCAAMLGTASIQAADTKTVYTFDVFRTIDQTDVSVCPTNTSVLGNVLNCASEGSFAIALANSVVKFYAVNAAGSYAAKNSYSLYFTTAGAAVTAANKNKAISTVFDEKAAVNLNTFNDKLEEGSSYQVKEAFINVNTKDTVELHFNVIIGNKKKVVTDMPLFNHRKDKIDSWLATPYVQQNDDEGEVSNCIQVAPGDKITMGLRVRNEGDRVVFNVKNAAGKTLKNFTANDFVIDDVTKADIGTYTMTARYTPEGESMKVQTCSFFVDVQEHQGEYFDWDADGPKWSYDFRDEYPEGFAVPTKTHTFKKKDGTDANQVHGEWWSVYWGDNLNLECGNAATAKKAMENAVAKYDVDFAYIRNEMGWPPDINARQGWKSFVYVFGSGLANDNTSSTEKGGYQSQTYVDGRSWPCVWASYYPMSRFRDDADKKWDDGDYQREAMIHEGIHALFADYPGCKKSAWFQEAGNVWLQGAMNAKRGLGAQVSGWLGVGNLICPFMPIECYSGWLQDGSFGGPAAEGVNMYNGSQQICTWRNLIGGVQYGETFPIFLGLNVGYGSVPWIWRYCTDYVLKGIALGNTAEGVEGIGDEGMRQLIMHYRAKLATMDFKESSNGMRSLLDGYFGAVVKAEWEPYWIDVPPFTLTPYQTLEQNDADGWMAPDTVTNPGWSGGNIIPIHVGKNGCEVFFRPEDDNMRCQLCYRTRDGRTFYSQPVQCGKMKLTWTSSNKPANDVVFIVPCNTDYIYTGDAQRKKHWDYRIKLGEGAIAPASIRKKWYFYEQTITDEDYVTGIETPEVADAGIQSENTEFRILSGVLHSGQQVRFDLAGVNPSDVVAHLVGISGVVVEEQPMSSESTIQLPANLRRGMYILALRYNGKVSSFKVFVE